MTTDEHIQKLIEHRDYCLRSAHYWIQTAHDKPVNEDGRNSVAKEMGEYRLWLEKALKTTEMIDALKPMRVVKALCVGCVVALRL